MIKYVAVQFDNSLGYREYITEEKFEVVEDAIAFIEKQPDPQFHSYEWAIEVEWK